MYRTSAVYSVLFLGTGELREVRADSGPVFLSISPVREPSTVI